MWWTQNVTSITHMWHVWIPHIKHGDAISTRMNSKYTCANGLCTYHTTLAKIIPLIRAHAASDTDSIEFFWNCQNNQLVSVLIQNQLITGASTHRVLLYEWACSNRNVWTNVLSIGRTNICHMWKWKGRNDNITSRNFKAEI